MPTTENGAKGRFAAWLQVAVADIPPSMAGRRGHRKGWSARLADEIGLLEFSSPSGDYDRALRRYHSGEGGNPRSQQAFAIGEGLRVLGVSWCSGALGVYAAGHLDVFYRIIAWMSGFGLLQADAVRLSFLASAATRNPVIDDYPVSVSLGARAELASIKAPEIAGIWQGLGHREKRFPIGGLVGPGGAYRLDARLQLAVTIADAKAVPFDDRDAVASRAVASWARMNATTRALERTLRWRAPFAEPEDLAEARRAFASQEASAALARAYAPSTNPKESEK